LSIEINAILLPIGKRAKTRGGGTIKNIPTVHESYPCEESRILIAVGNGAACQTLLQTPCMIFSLERFDELVVAAEAVFARSAELRDSCGRTDDEIAHRSGRARGAEHQTPAGWTGDASRKAPRRRQEARAAAVTRPEGPARREVVDRRERMVKVVKLAREVSRFKGPNFVVQYLVIRRMS